MCNPHNIKLKSDVATCHQNCYAILPPERLRRLTWCYMPWWILLAFPFPASATTNEEPILDRVNLVCDVQSFFDVKKAASEATTGKDLLVVFSQDASDMIVISLDKKLFQGKQSDTGFEGSLSWDTDDEPPKAVEENIKVNRYTGDYSRSMFIGEEAGFVFSGECRLAQERKF